MRRHCPQLESRDRRGGALVEFAICLPLLTVLIFGSIEAANAIFLRQALVATAFESAQVATAPGGDAAQAKTRGEAVLKARKIKKGTITLSPNVNSSTAPGTTVTVTVTAPATSNSVSPVWFLSKVTVRSQVVMVKL